MDCSPISSTGAVTTLTATIGTGPRLAAGGDRDYYGVETGAGEPRLARADLGGRPAGPASADGAVLYLAQFSDMQITDVQSPGRIEFLEALRGLPGEDIYVPVARPQEALSLHGFDAAVDTMNALGPSPDTGRRLDLALSTGDNIDNAQANELDWFLTVLGGGVVDQNSGAGGYQGAQAPDWDNPVVWHPEGGADRFTGRWGFPRSPGLLAAAMAPFTARGLSLPWLSCFGNHEGLVQGVASPTSGYGELLRGALKGAALPDDIDPVRDAAVFLRSPERFMTGYPRPVAADQRRRVLTREDFARFILTASGAPAGHGLTADNVRDGTTYGCHDMSTGAVPVRLITLDTADLDGESEATSGGIGAVQLGWLTDRLREVHSSWWDPDGTPRRADHPDSLVVLASHHSLATMSQAGGTPRRGYEQDSRRIPAPQLADLLHRFPNVVLWLSGHEHVNRIMARPDPKRRTPGFWDVSSPATIDWPCQLRLVELVMDGLDQLVILTTMADLAVPARPKDATGRSRLASLQRELAANDPYRGMFGMTTASTAGLPRDRNAVLLRPVSLRRA